MTGALITVAGYAISLVMLAALIGVAMCVGQGTLYVIERISIAFGWDPNRTDCADCKGIRHLRKSETALCGRCEELDAEMQVW